MELHSLCLTIRNRMPYSKPNEDSFLNDDASQIYIIADGVSRDFENGSYPLPSPSKEVADLFVQKAYEYLLQHKASQDDLCAVIHDAFLYANRSVAAANVNRPEYFRPGTVGIICVIASACLYYGYIGDCEGFAYNDKTRHVFTKCQTELIHKHRSEFSNIEVRTNICNNPTHPYSYGVINGSADAEAFIRTGKIPFEDNYGLILCTDGAQEALDCLTNDEIGGFTAEDFLNRLHLSKSDDDKTVIIVRKAESNEYRNQKIIS